ncbi:MAG: D-2-hydroxyacid dehydrogenase [Acholeplasmataceae bacterium]|nr:D-2-hydroxyacid dehydrogenase [Acholeplasmataceae bacterium]
MLIYMDDRFLDLEALYALAETTKGFSITTDPNDFSKVDVVMVMPSFFKDKELNMIPKLSWVQLMAAGYDGLDLEAFRKRNIVVTNAKDVYSIQIAEDVFSKILFLNRHLDRYHAQMKTKVWDRHRVNHEIYGSVAGIVGAGAIGIEIAKRMKAFGAKTIGYRTRQIETPHMDETVTGPAGFDRLLHESDYVIAALPLTKHTKHIFDAAVFAKMKENAMFVNIARGGIVAQDALVHALKTKTIRAAALDVTDPEPLPADHELWTMKEVLITPHVASESPFQIQRLTALLETNIRRALENASLENIIT